MQLHPLPGDGRFYCGPAAIASFTGLHPKDDLRPLINKARGFRPSQGVISMSNDLVEKVLNGLGLKISGFYDVEPREILNGYIKGRGYYRGRKVWPTLRQFMEANAFQGAFIVNVSHHYIAVSGRNCQDNQSGAIYDIAKFTGARKKVRKVCAIYQ